MSPERGRVERPIKRDGCGHEQGRRSRCFASSRESLYEPAAEPADSARTGYPSSARPRWPAFRRFSCRSSRRRSFSIVEPTGPIGDAGWVLALGGIAAVVAVGAFLVRAPSVSATALGGANAFTAGVLAMLAWLTGGFDSPFLLLFPLLASSITPHTSAHPAHPPGVAPARARQPLLLRGQPRAA